MNVLILGTGGREHALAWKCSLSSKVEKVIVSPGNIGMSYDEKIQIQNLDLNNHNTIIEYVKKNNIALTIVGPENLLADGIVDSFQAKGLPIFGPSKKASQIESSKAFSKDLMKECYVPTADYRVFIDAGQAREFVENCQWADGIVVKCDGLAAGKGVVVTTNKKDALDAIEELLVQDKLGIKNDKIVLEERLVGREVSSFFLCEGEHFFFLGDACDYKTLRDEGQGPNTGGMGTYSPADWVNENIQAEIEEKVVAPLLKCMKDKGIPYTGVLFVGLMITDNGPKVIEFNCRFGDPETQVLLPRIESDLVEYFYQAACGKLSEIVNKKINYSDKTGVHLVLASKGYPGTEGIPVQKGIEIKWDRDFYQDLEKKKVGKLFFAGVKEENNKLVTNGGRVLGLSCLALDRKSTRDEVYKNIEKVNFEGSQRRGDIGQ